MSRPADVRLALLEQSDESNTKAIADIEQKLEDLMALVNKGKGMALFIALVFTGLQIAIAYKVLFGGGA